MSVFYQSITDSECTKAAQYVEQQEAALDELASVLAKYDSSQASTVVEPAKPAKPAKPLRTEEFDSLEAWLNSFSESRPSSNPILPGNFNNLLNQPIQPDDEYTMSSESFREALGLPTINSVSSSSSSQKITQDLSTSSQVASTHLASFTTPKRLPPAASTQAPKAARKPYTRKIGVRHYSRWSISHLQEEYLARFKPLSQKRTLDRQFMEDALTHLDAQESKTEAKRALVKSWAD